MFQGLRDLRNNKDMSQTEIAEVLRMSQTGYSKYETGENYFPTDAVIKLADFYETSTDYILGRTNRKAFKRKP